jgi:hypothetical protein
MLTPLRAKKWQKILAKSRYDKAGETLQEFATNVLAPAGLSRKEIRRVFHSPGNIPVKFQITDRNQDCPGLKAHFWTKISGAEVAGGG